MSESYDALETRDPAERERDLFGRLPDAVAAAKAAPVYAERFGAVDPRAVTSRDALARLPVLRKSDLPALQRATPPFGGLTPSPLAAFGRLFTSPGPIFEPEATGRDPWNSARGLHAAGLRAGDVVLNTFSYHLTPGGFIMDSAARALDCPVIPAGPGQTDAQLELIAAYRPSAYLGTPDFLNILLGAAAASGADLSCLTKAVVSGAAFPKSLQEVFESHGIAAYQAYATADFGIIAYETSARDGLVVNENLIVEIVRPGTGDPVAPGEVGEIVVTSLDPHHPRIRLAVGDLTALMPGASACGRTNLRIRGWMGRADQTAKVKGLFVRPEQVAEIGRRHPELGRLRLVIMRAVEADVMILKAEAPLDDDLAGAVSRTLQEVTRMRGQVELVCPGCLPNDGRVISDERPTS